MFFTSTGDWTSNSAQQVASSLGGLLTGRPKSPGLVTLEHEISDFDVDGFITTFPQIASNGWTFRSLAQALGSGASYQNAKTSTSDVTPKNILQQQQQPVPTTTSSTIATSSTPSPSPSSQRSGSQQLLIPHITLCLVSLFAIVL